MRQLTFEWVYSLQDLIARNEINRQVTDLVNLDRVRSLLKTITSRRHFLAHLEKKRAEKYEKGILFLFSLIFRVPQKILYKQKFHPFSWRICPKRLQCRQGILPALGWDLST